MTEEQWKLKEEVLGGREKILSIVMNTYNDFAKYIPLGNNEQKHLAAKKLIIAQLSPSTFGKISAFTMLNSLSGVSLFSMMGLYEEDSSKIRASFVELTKNIEKEFGYSKEECIYYFLEYSYIIKKSVDSYYAKVEYYPENLSMFMHSMVRVIKAIHHQSN